MRLTANGVAAVLGAAVLAAGSIFISSLAMAGAAVGLIGALALAARTRPPRARATRAASLNVCREGETIRMTTTVHATGPVKVVDPLPRGTTLSAGSNEGVGAHVRLEYEIVPRAPGRLQFHPVRVVTADAFGLFEHVIEIDASLDVLVLPRIDDVGRAPLVSRRFVPTGGRHLVGQAGGGSEFFALRDYQPGDTMRQVNWRASARTGGKLVVNQREMESQGTIAYFLDCRAIAAVGTWERNAWADGVRAVASLSLMSAKARDRPTLFPYGEATHEPLVGRPGDTGLVGLHTNLARTSIEGKIPSRAAVDKALPRLSRRGAAVIVSHLLDDETLPNSVAALCALDQQVTILALDGPSYLRLAGAKEARLARERETRRQRILALQAQGALVIEVAHDESLAMAIGRSVVA